MEKITKLKQEFEIESIDGYLVPKNDKFLGEYIPEYDDRLKYISEFSGSFGSFDRAYWQYKIKDFSSGMSQEAIYPLALAVKNKIINPKTNKNKVEINKLIKNGAIYSLNKQNFNGSVDDYFPYEQASGATAFTSFALMNCLEIGIGKTYLKLMLTYWIMPNRN